jgi:hypothetical protein
VITGSIVSVISDPDQPTFFTESDWHEAAVQTIKREGDKADPGVIYTASKVLAEKGMCAVVFQTVPADTNCDYLDTTAAWEYYEENKGKIGWDLVVLLPPFVRYLCCLFLHEKSDTSSCIGIWCKNMDAFAAFFKYSYALSFSPQSRKSTPPRT